MIATADMTLINIRSGHYYFFHVGSLNPISLQEENQDPEERHLSYKFLVKLIDFREADGVGSLKDPLN